MEHTGKETVASQGRQEPCHVGTRGLRGFLCGNEQGAEAWGVGLTPQHVHNTCGAALSL